MSKENTILLWKDVEAHLLRERNLRGLSRVIKEILDKVLVHSKESMFGADPWLTPRGLRDEGEQDGGR